MITEPLFKKYYKTLIHFAGKIVPEDECHDIVIEVMIRVPVEGYEEKQTSRYLYDGVKMGCIDWLRAEKRHGASYKEILYLSSEADLKIETSMVETITLADILNAINQMAPQTRQVMKRHIKGESSNQIATKMGIKARTVINLRNWGKKHLKAIITTGKPLADLTSRIWDTEGVPLATIKNRVNNRMRKREIAAAKKQSLALG